MDASRAGATDVEEGLGTDHGASLGIRRPIDLRGDTAARGGVSKVGSPAGLLHDLHPRSPCRLPDWRMRLAHHLVASPRSRLRRLADGPAREALDYLRALRRYRSEAGRRRLSARMPDVAAALALRAGDPAARHEVEARLLAAQGDRAIADRCGIAPGAVAAYGRLCFDVRGRLGASSYILHVAIGPVIPPGCDRPDPFRAWKLLAYGGGALVLDAAAGASDEGESGRLATLLDAMGLAAGGRDVGPLLRLIGRMGRLREEAAARSTRPLVRPAFPPAPEEELIGLATGAASRLGTASALGGRPPDRLPEEGFADVGDDPLPGAVLPWPPSWAPPRGPDGRAMSA